MRSAAGKLVFVAGWVVLAAILLILLSAAYLGGGHPPASGIARVVIVAVAAPVALAASIVGLLRRPRPDQPADKWFFVMTGVCVAFTVFVAALFVLKVLLGRPV
jgi:type VI protein secretion system component VasK